MGDPVRTDRAAEVGHDIRHERRDAGPARRDPAGALWVAASPRRGGHVVARFEVSAGALVPTGWASGRGRLAGPIRASDRGLSVVLERGRRGELIGYAIGELRDAPGALGACF